MVNLKNSDISDSKLYEAIGLAAINCQYFEIAFTVCVKLVFAQSTALKIQDIKPLDRNSFRPPTKALLKELCNHVRVHSDFEARLSNVVERRHTLLHRWILNKGWPSLDDNNARMELLEYANNLSIEINALTRIVVGYITAWSHQFPELSAVDLPDNWLETLPEELKNLKIEET